jgi:hypothetical protein
MADLAEVAQFLDRSEVLIARGVLEAAGIFAVVPNLETLGVAPHYVFATGGFQLLVRADLLEDAREVLRAAQLDALNDPD